MRDLAGSWHPFPGMLSVCLAPAQTTSVMVSIVVSLPNPVGNSHEPSRQMSELQQHFHFSLLFASLGCGGVSKQRQSRHFSPNPGGVFK